MGKFSCFYRLQTATKNCILCAFLSLCLLLCIKLYFKPHISEQSPNQFLSPSPPASDHHQPFSIKAEKPNVKKSQLSTPQHQEVDQRCTSPYDLSLDPNPKSRPGTCQRSRPDQSTCNIIKDLFFSSNVPSCDTTPENKICSIMKISHGYYSVECSPNLCNRNIKLGIVNPQSGTIQWQHMPSLSSLVDQITLIIHSKTSHFGFCFIKCQAETVEIKQLLILPPPLLNHSSSRYGHQQHASRMNINLIIIDSVSRSHFYRSLPTAVDLLQSLQVSNRGQPKMKIFDYMNVQSLKPRTHESMKALFSGVVNRKTDVFELKDLPPEAVSVEKLLKPLKDLSYTSLWLEDLCWMYEWGLVNDLAVSSISRSPQEKWQLFQKALQKASIDYYDISVANCEIFQDLRITNHFHNPLEVCYEGIPHQNYLLEYLWQFQSTLHEHGKPFVTVFTPNIAHEDTGRRIQMLDKPFTEYLKRLATLENTFTVIVSDHGNNYGAFPELTFEGRLESFNPLLLILMPTKLASKFDEELLLALRENQNKLLTIQDVHLTLQDFIAIQEDQPVPLKTNLPHHPVSLFQPLPSDRNCSSLPLLLPNLCLCQGLDIPVRNQIDSVLVAEFALGQLNELLRRQMRQAPTADGVKCERLEGLSYSKMRESHSQMQSVTTTFDMQVHAQGVKESNEIFFVTVETSYKDMKEMKTLRQDRMKLRAFERISPYSQYKSCAGGVVDTRLCLCNTRQTHLLNHSPSQLQDIASYISNPPVVFSTQTSVYSVDMRNANIQPCLYIIYRKHSVGATFDLASLCHGWLVKVEFTLRGNNILTSHAMPLRVDIHPNEVRFLCVVRQLVVHLPWEWSYGLEYTMQYVKQ